MNGSLSPYELTPEAREKLAAKAVMLRQSGFSWQQICQTSPISLRTLQNYMTRDMSAVSQLNRLKNCGRPSSLNYAEETAVITMAEQQRAVFCIVDIEWTKAVVNFATAGRFKPSDSWIARFWRKHGWHHRRVQARNYKELRTTMNAEIATFQQNVNEYVESNDIDAKDIWVMDEVGLWTGAVSQMTYVNPLTHDCSALQVGDHRRDTGIVALSAAGNVYDAFLEHHPQKTKKEDGKNVVVDKGVSGVGLPQMTKWATDFANSRPPDVASVLLLDQLAAHKNAQVLSILRGKKVEPFLLPPQASKHISPNDNSFFSSLKSQLAKKDTSTVILKKAEFHRLCNNYPPEVIRKFWTHCNWHFNIKGDVVEDQSEDDEVEGN